MIPILDEEEIGRRIDQAQRPVDGQRRGRQRAGEALRKHHLNDLAVGNVLPGLVDHPMKVGGFHIGPGMQSFRLPGGGRNDGWRGLAQTIPDHPDPGFGVRVGGGRRRKAVHVRTGHHNHGMADIVEHNHVVGQHHAGFRIFIVGFRRRQLFKLIDGLVADVADRAREKPR